MKRSILLLFVLLCGIAAKAQDKSLETLRRGYYKLHTDSASCARLYAQVSQTTSADNTYNAYKGAITASMANHVKNAAEKLKLFNEGKALLEQSIKNDASNTELRFLRLTIQTNCPKALGYNKQIEGDKTFIADHLETVKDASLQQKIKDYMVAHKYLILKKPEAVPN